MPLERIDVRRPEAPERRQPRIDFLKWFRFEAVQTALRIDRRFDEARIAQDAQVLRDGRLRHVKTPLDFAHGLLREDQEVQDSAPVWLRNDIEHRFHIFDIPQLVYACQGIFGAGRYLE